MLFAAGSLPRSATGDAQVGISAKDAKAKNERAVFSQFAAAAQLPVVAGTIESRPEPEPDILCRVEGDGLVAFELVRLVDQNYARGMEVLGRAHREARDFVDGLAGEQGEQFRAMYADALIGVEIGNAITNRHWRESLPLLVPLLLQQAAGVVDQDLAIPEDLRGRFHRVSVYRGVAGPIIDPSFMHRVGDPTLERITEKFEPDRYETGHPKELLAYVYGIDLLYPENVWLPMYATKLAELREQSDFRRLWVYKGGIEQPRVVLCTPDR